MKKILILLLLIIILLCSCGQKSSPLSISQDVDNIIKIELINNTIEYDTVQYTLSNDEIEGFIDSLLEIPCYTHHPPCSEYGYLAVRLHYENGDIETIGTDAIGYKTSGMTRISGKYYVPIDNMIDLFSVYIDDEEITDIYSNI